MCCLLALLGICYGADCRRRSSAAAGAGAGTSAAAAAAAAEQRFPYYCCWCKYIGMPRIPTTG